MTSDSLLGEPTVYPVRYAPEILRPIARALSRTALRLPEPTPFSGSDIWNAWDLTWLGPDQMPQIATAEIRVPAHTPNLIESKSLKLYLGSFAMMHAESSDDVAKTLAADIGSAAGGEVDVRLRTPEESTYAQPGRLPGHCIDSQAVGCDTWQVDASLLTASDADIAAEDLYSHLLRSLCPVTGQPDIGSVLISYRGPRIDRGGLLRYIASYREHNDFHEACVERMFVDILKRCVPERLSVYARYQRRGGIDINPFRSNFEDDPPNVRLWRQ